jgi:hypothetical protein
LIDVVVDHNELEWLQALEGGRSQGFDLALERMGANQIEILPVVNRADVHKLEGIVALQDVLDAYGLSRT